jgi:hypothetical protein
MEILVYGKCHSIAARHRNTHHFVIFMVVQQCNRLLYFVSNLLTSCTDSEDLIEPESTSIQPFAVLCGHHAEPISALVCAVEGIGTREISREKHVLVSADLSSCMCVWSLDDGVCLRVCRLSWLPCSLLLLILVRTHFGTAPDQHLLGVHLRW